MQTPPEADPAARLLQSLGGLDLASADGRAGIRALLSEIERLAPGAILRQAASIELDRVGWRRDSARGDDGGRPACEAPRAGRCRLVIPAKAGTHRPRAQPGLRPVGAEHHLPADGLPGTGHLLGAAARGERGCGDDVKGDWVHRSFRLGPWPNVVMLLQLGLHLHAEALCSNELLRSLM